MTHPEISIVVAMDRRGVIGRGGGLPWRLPSDLQRFRRVTMGKPIVMGRRTHESIGRPLPGRDNLVVSRSHDYRAPGCRVVGSLTEACEASSGAAEIMVIGGAALYREALDTACRIYLTEVHAEVDGDVYFPPLDRGRWREIEREDRRPDERNPYPHSFLLLVR